jgi:hypothetical protein
LINFLLVNKGFLLLNIFLGYPSCRKFLPILRISFLLNLTKKNKAIVRFNKKEILNIGMNFLHEGYPRKIFKSKKPLLTNKKLIKIKIKNYKNILCVNIVFQNIQGI